MTDDVKEIKEDDVFKVDITSGEEGHTLSWTEFSQNTTFHGVNHIYQQSRGTFRRILWLICWVASVFLFIYQVATRIGFFMQFPTNVDVSIIYNKSLDFPSVTICNLNQLRLRAAVDTGLFDLLNSVHAVKDGKVGQINKTMFPLDTNTKELFHRLAPMKTNFIERCKWNSMPCDVETSFTTVDTDMGVCFTFNKLNISTPSLIMEQPGAQAGLSLILNVEQYEYMTGPQIDAGVKVYLHDWKEFPLVNDMGFLVAPGTHTSVSVRRKDVKTLEAPYGMCSYKAHPMNNCKLKCITKEAVDICGCRDYFMPNIFENDSLPVCDVKQKVICITNLMFGYKPFRQCTCSQPCNQRLYSPQLSSSKLSRFNIEPSLFSNITRKAEISKGFHESLETAERWMTHKVMLNNRLTNHVTEGYQSLVTIVTYATDVVFNSTLLAQELKTLDVLGHGSHLLKFDLRTIILSIDDLKIAAEEFDFNESKLMQMVFGKMTHHSAEVLENAYELYADACVAGQTSRCSRLKDYTVKLGHSANMISQSVKDWTAFYENGTEYLFKESSTKPSDYREHTLCIKGLRKFSGAWFNLSKLCEQALEKMTNPSTILSEYESVMKKWRNSTTDHLMYPMDDTLNCNWIDNMLEMDPEYHNLELILTSLLDSLAVVRYNYQFLRLIFRWSLTEILSEVEPCIHLIKQFQNRNITKLYMAKVVLSNCTEDFSSLENSMVLLEQYLLKMHQYLVMVDESLLELCSAMEAVPVKLFSKTRFGDFQLMKAANQSSNIKIKEILNREDSNGTITCRNYIDICHRLVWDFYTPVLQTSEECYYAMKSLLEKALELQDHLKLNELSSQMKEDFYEQNFLVLDIYYSEMSYERVTQLKSFMFLSLIGEIGGFMGLFLGASVLTIIELLDHLFSILVALIKQKNATSVSPIKVKD